MDFQAKCYEQIVIATLSGTVTASDMAAYEPAARDVFRNPSVLITDFNAAKFDASSLGALIGIRKKFASRKFKFFVVSKHAPGMDAKAVIDILRTIKTSEAERITQILGIQDNLIHIKEKALRAEMEASKLLRAALKIPAMDKPMPASEFTNEFRKLTDRDEKLRKSCILWNQSVEARRLQRLRVLGHVKGDSKLAGKLMDVSKWVSESMRKLDK